MSALSTAGGAAQARAITRELAGLLVAERLWKLSQACGNIGI
jgi:hypothetical protein